MAISSLAKRIPKIHLHCHLEGSLRPSTFVELAAKHGVPLRYKRPNQPSFVLRQAQDDKAQDDPDAIDGDPYAFKTFDEFLMIFAALSRSLRNAEDYARLAREFVEDALAQNVIYGELFISPSVWTFFNPDLDVRATMEAIVHELRGAQPAATFKLLPDLTRNFGPVSAMATARAMADMTDLDVIGVSLGGDETRFPPRLFADVFSFARMQGLHCVAHAGEAAGAHSVREAIDLLRVERVGHGIRALEDVGTVQMLAARQIPLEICPTSNRLTGAVLSGHPHPFVELDQRGCIVTIDCDDPAVFGASIQHEYACVEQIAGAPALARFVGNAIQASFAGAELKRSMELRLSAAVPELHAAPRS